MNWYEIIGIAGLGGVTGSIFIKLMDIVWLQRVLKNREKEVWLRDQKIQAFEQLSKYLLALGVHKEGAQNAFDLYAHSARAFLLIKDVELIDRIDRFIVDFDSLHGAKNTKAQEREYYRLVREGKQLVEDLRSNLLST